MVVLITRILYIIIAIVSVGSIGFIAIYYLFLKNRKSKGTKIIDLKDGKVPIKPTHELVVIDDVVDRVAVFNGGKSFIMAIRAMGCEYHSSYSEEKHRIEENYTEIWNVIDKPMQYHVQSRKNNIDATIEKYKAAIKRQDEKFNQLSMELGVLENNLSEYSKGSNQEVLLLKERERLLVKIEAARLLSESLTEQLNHMFQLINNREFPKRHHYYILEYTFDDLGIGVELTPYEIRKRAVADLTSRANGFINGLARCSVNAHIVDDNELVDMLRKYMNPYAGDNFRFKDIADTNFDSLLVGKEERTGIDDMLEKIFEEVLA